MIKKQLLTFLKINRIHLNPVHFQKFKGDNMSKNLFPLKKFWSHNSAGGVIKNIGLYFSTLDATETSYTHLKAIIVL